MQRAFHPAVYMLASGRNGTLYIGVTSDLVGRLHQHRTGAAVGFTSRYGVRHLVWFEQHATMAYAIAREKQLKKWKRAWKLKLIERSNPGWRDLSEDLGFEPISQAGFPPSRE